MLPDRFWQKVDGREDPEGCWLWRSAHKAGTYGIAWLDGRSVGAHRAAYIDARGAIPAGTQLDHLCRNRACVNPAHLEAVTCAENIRRGRLAKLTEAEVREIRRRYDAGGVLQRELGEEFGVSQRAISHAIKGSTWASATETKETTT